MASFPRAAAPLRAMRCARRPFLGSRAGFSMSSTRQGGGHSNESQFDPPTGWLFGVKPGQKTEYEGWEWPMVAFGATIVGTGVAFAFSPDTTVSTWALEEARRRLEAEGILPDPFPNPPQDKKE